MRTGPCGGCGTTIDYEHPECPACEAAQEAEEELIAERTEAVGDIVFLLNYLGWRLHDFGSSFEHGETLLLCDYCTMLVGYRIQVDYFDEEIGEFEDPSIEIQCETCGDVLEYELPTMEG